MKDTKGTSFTKVIFAKCKDDFDRIRVLMNLYGCNQLDANRYLAKLREEGKLDD